MKNVRFISASVLVQTSETGFLNVTISNRPGAPPAVNVSVVGPGDSPDEIRRIVEVMLEHLNGLDRLDVTPSRIVRIVE